MIPFRVVRLLMPALLVLASSLPALGQAQGQAVCRAPDAVCAAASRVFRIAAFDPLASAVLIGPGLFVTNRHAVADSGEVVIFLPAERPGGGRVTARVVPTAYGGDLILFRAPEVTTPAPLRTARATLEGRFYTIGADRRGRAIRVYEPGRLLLPLAEGKPWARLHNDAYSQAGNSGGALVDSKGRLVAIVTSGGDGRNEAIPAAEIEKLIRLSGPGHQAPSRALGRAYRTCIEALEAETSAELKDRCGRTNNRQLWDLAGQTLARQGKTEDAIEMFSRALDQDPNAINSMMSLAIALHLSGRYADEAPHLRRLIEILPSDAGVLRLGVQAGAWGGDKALMQKSLRLMETHYPRLAPLARSFIEKNPTPPARRQRR